MVFLASSDCSKVYDQLNLTIDQLKHSETLANIFEVSVPLNEENLCIIDSANLKIIQIIAHILA